MRTSQWSAPASKSLRLVRSVRGGLLACLLGLAVASPAQAALFDDDEARKAILDLRAKVDATQRDLSARMDKLEAAQRGQLDLNNQIEALRQEVARLRGQVELLSNDLANEQKRQKDFYNDLDARLRKVEPQQVTVDGKTATVDLSEGKAFDSSLALFKASDYKGAIAAFMNFQRNYPDSAYGPASQYWIGASYYAQRDYRSAIVAQQTVVSKWPDSPRAADALMNIASAQTDMGDKKAAKKTLESLVAKYPDSQAAGQARDRLATLK